MHYRCENRSNGRHRTIHQRQNPKSQLYSADVARLADLVRPAVVSQDHAAIRRGRHPRPGRPAANDHPQPASIPRMLSLEKRSELLSPVPGSGCALRALLPGCFRERCRQWFARDHPRFLVARTSVPRNDRCRVPSDFGASRRDLIAEVRLPFRRFECDHRPRFTEPTGATGGFFGDVHSVGPALARAAAIPPPIASTSVPAGAKNRTNPGSHRTRRWRAGFDLGPPYIFGSGDCHSCA